MVAKMERKALKAYILDLDGTLLDFLAAEKERTGKRVSQKDFVVGLIVQALDAHDAAEQKTE